MKSSHFKGYIEVPHSVFRETRDLLRARRREVISEEVRHGIDEIIGGYSATKDKPTWLVGDKTARCIKWKESKYGDNYYLVLEGEL